MSPVAQIKKLQPRGPMEHIAEKYDQVTQQGKGSYGVVYEAICRET